jgi:WD40 repeat protein
VDLAQVPTGCVGGALAPDGERLACVGGGGVWLTSLSEGRGRWLVDPTRFPGMVQAAAWDPSGRRVTAGSTYWAATPNELVVFDLESGSERRLSLVPPGERGRGYDWGAEHLAFTPDGRLLVAGSGGVRRFDPGTGSFTWIWRLAGQFSTRMATTADGRRLAALADDLDGAKSPVTTVLVDLASDTTRTVQTHGRQVTALALDVTGRTLVTGDREGALRTGSWEGGEPHRLCCHTGGVTAIAVSPDGKWIASASGGEVRLWPMPDVTKPPLHTLKYDVLLTKLRALTNLEVVADQVSPTGYRLEVGPFPGWKEVPTW